MTLHGRVSGTTSPCTGPAGTQRNPARPRRRAEKRTALTAVAALALGLALTAAPPHAAATEDTGGGNGHLDHHASLTEHGVNDYLVYAPAGWKPSDRLPLYVMLHGCGTTASEQMNASLMNTVADRERFLVAYPDNGGQCWGAVFPLPPHTNRGGGGDADIIAGITRQVIADYSADTQRVYLAGMSSGAFQASATAAAYPDVYAAVGVNAGGGPGMDASCATLIDPSAPYFASRGVEQMGRQARVMPFFSIGGTLDPLGERPTVGGCSRLAYLSWLGADNALAHGADGDTYRDDPASTVNGQVPGGHTWTKYVARDRSNCEIAERWVVHDMNHYWSGGSTDEKYWGDRPDGSTGFNDPKGPSASEETWRFFHQFTLDGGNTTCPAS
ncbi:extracellular catalytic domain type 1 short-chain-length polyhydroxyalkanoate depolymerase [Nocardia africana]